MTFILTLGNEDQFIQISDRRLSSNGHIVDDDVFKAGVFICDNARLVFGFTGLAKYGNFNTERWLLESIANTGAPNFDALTILDRLTEKATKDFNNLHIIAKVPQEHKRLSIMFSGYLYHHTPPLGAFAIITNFQNFDIGKDDNKAWDAFKCKYWSEKRPNTEVMTLVQRVGVWQAMTRYDEMSLRHMLSERRPAHAILDKAVDIIRNMADRPQAAGYIGKQLSSVILPRDVKIAPTSEYHTMYAKSVTYLTPMVMSSSKGQLAIGEPEVKVSNSDNTPVPVVFPKVGRNEPCPCGSGKKYKRCHGKNRR